MTLKEQTSPTLTKSMNILLQFACAWYKTIRVSCYKNTFWRQYTKRHKAIYTLLYVCTEWLPAKYVTFSLIPAGLSFSKYKCEHWIWGPAFENQLKMSVSLHVIRRTETVSHLNFEDSCNSWFKSTIPLLNRTFSDTEFWVKTSAKNIIRLRNHLLIGILELKTLLVMREGNEKSLKSGIQMNNGYFILQVYITAEHLSSLRVCQAFNVAFVKQYLAFSWPSERKRCQVPDDTLVISCYENQ